MLFAARLFNQPPGIGKFRSFLRGSSAPECHAQHNAGQLSERKPSIGKILQVNPSHTVALRLLGVIASQSGQSAKALELLDRPFKSIQSCRGLL